jgi:hypothetical protein
VVCERIEEKMGLHGSPTCVMRFDDATAWRVGEIGKGLNAMFVMMNAARLHVGMQGVGLLDAAWQKAHAYAQERRQMRAPGPRDASQAADLIVQHPAVQRLLDTQRAWVDAGRVLAYQTALELDVAKHHPNSARRQQAQRWCSLVTPVLKASWTDQAFHGSSDCLQVFGGHGYVREWGIEQIVRDSRVAMIYEGTNEIQAQDLLFRKVLSDQGQALRGLLEQLQNDPLVDQSPAAEILQQTTARQASLLDPFKQLNAEQTLALYPVAGDFLRVTTLTLMAWAWARLSQHAEVLASPGANQAFVRWILPEHAMRTDMVRNAISSAPATP